MKEDKASKTAEAVAAIRAKHLLHDSPVVFSDPWAIRLTSPAWRFICQSRLLTWLVFDKIFAALRPVQGNVLARARFVEDTLDTVSATHTVDYVILGAGLDSFALRQRHLQDRLHVWEIDLPHTQAQKRLKLEDCHASIPDNVAFIAADVTSSTFEETLRDLKFRSGSIGLFSLLGVSYYLPEEALFRLIGWIAQYFKGSELVMDIRVTKAFVEPRYLPTFEKTQRFTAKRGERMISNFDPQQFIRRTRELGMELQESLSPQAQRDRYFANRQDGLVPSPEVYLLRFKAT
jgi:methyltransferase (TIGR00027 family)